MTAPFIFDQPNQPDAEAQRLRATLNALVDMAADIARATHAQIMALPEPGAQRAPRPKPQPIRNRGPNPPSPRPTRSPRSPPVSTRPPAPPVSASCCCNAWLTRPNRQTSPNNDNAARRRIIREVEDAIQREVEGEAALNFGYELDERLDLLDVNREITSRPPQEIITEILRDFGLTAIPGTRPWKRRTPPEIIELNVWAADPPKPFMPRQFAETAEPGRSGPRSERP